MLRSLLVLAAIGALCLALPAAALERPTQVLGPIKAPRLDAEDVTITTGSPSAPCLSTAGAFDPVGSGAWEPTCFGAFLSANMVIKVYPTRGAGREAGNPVPTNPQYTRSLIQGQGNGAVEKEASGQFINWECVGGAVSAAKLDSTNCTGQLISVRTRPGLNGEKPPTSWGFNVDVAMSQTPTPGQVHVGELDLNNYTGWDCYAGSNCLTTGMFLNGIGSFTNTAWIYSGGGTTERRGNTVTVANNTVTRVSGPAFRQSTYRIKINNVFYRVAYVNGNTLIGHVAIPAVSTATAATWQNAMVAYGVLFQGENMASESDLALNTSAYNAVRVAGNHHVGLDTTGDTLSFAATVGAGQKVCLNGFDACLYFSKGTLKFSNGGVEKTVTLQ